MAFMRESIYGFVDDINSLPMEFQKIDGASLDNSFPLLKITLVSKLHCIRASQ